MKKYFIKFYAITVFTLLLSSLSYSGMNYSGNGKSKKSEYRIKSEKVSVNKTVDNFKKQLRKHYDKYIYDKANRLIGVDSIDKGKYRIQYDNLGRKVSESYGDTEIRKFYYDILGRLTKEEFIKGEEIDEVLYKYSTPPESYLLGEKIGKIEKNEQSFYKYFKGRLIEEKKIIRGNEFILKYSYNNMGLLESIRYPSGIKVFYEYDEFNKVNKIVLKKGNKESNLYSVEKTSLKGKIKFGNGLEKLWKVDQEKRELLIRTDGIQKYRVQYNDRGLIKKVVNKLNRRSSKEFYYDKHERLITAYGPWGRISYRYDDMDNLLQKVEKGKMLKFKYGDKSSKILNLKENGKSINVQYDKLGRMINYGEMKFEYGVRGRLRRIIEKDKVISEMHYNIKNQRVIEKNSGNHFHYIYDQKDRMIAKYKANGNLIEEYIYKDYFPIAKIVNNEIYYFHYDPINFPVKITDSNKEIVRDVEYKPYGEITSEKGDIKDGYLFPGQYRIQNTNIYYNLNRTYISSLGRYIEPDPAYLYVNIYQYGIANPIHNYDFNGCVYWQYKNRGSSSFYLTSLSVKNIFEIGLLSGDLTNKSYIGQDGRKWKCYFWEEDRCYRQFWGRIKRIVMGGIGLDVKNIPKITKYFPNGIKFKAELESDICRKYPDEKDFGDKESENVYLKIDVNTNSGELQIGHLLSFSLKILNRSGALYEVIPVVEVFGKGGSRTGGHERCFWDEPNLDPKECKEE